MNLRIGVAHDRSVKRLGFLVSVSLLALGVGPIMAEEPAQPVKAEAVATKPKKDKKIAQSAESAEELPEIIVTAKAGRVVKDEGFVGTEVSSGPYGGEPLSNIPKSIQVVTQDLMKSQQAQSVAGALRNVSGVDVLFSDQPRVRGFLAPVQTDGAASGLFLSSQMARPVDGIARIEVLKGADALLAGNMSPGGVINIVRKRPQEEKLREFTLEGGSFGHAKSSLDMTGPFVEGGKLTYRMIVSGQHDEEDFFGQDGTRNGYLAPSLGFSNEGTNIVIGGELLDKRFPETPWTLFGSDGRPMPPSKRLRAAGAELALGGKGAYADIEHEFDNGLSVHGKIEYSHADLRVAGYTPFPFALAPAGYLFFPTQANIKQDDLTLNGDLTYELATGSAKHKLTLGARYFDTTTDNGLNRGAEIFDVTDGLPDLALPSVPQKPFNDAQLTTYYLQDQVSWGDVHVLASITRNAISQVREGQAADQSAWTPNLGAAWQMTDNLALFASWQNSFSPQSVKPQYQFDGSPPPVKGTTYETGIKLNLLDDRLSATASVFYSEDRDQLDQDPDHPDRMKVFEKDVSRGFELDVNGRIADSWNIAANYTFSETDLSAILLKSKHRGNVWLSYEIEQGSWKGFGAGVGVTARSGAHNDDLRYPAQAGVDASVSWKNETASLTLGVANLFNSRLYGEVGVASQRVFLQPTRTVLLTGTYRF